MSVKNIILFGIFFIPVLAHSQLNGPRLHWAKNIEGSVGIDIVHAIDVDAAGNVYVAGSFEGTVEFNPEGEISHTKTAQVRDAFFAKYSSGGECVWVKSIESTSESEIRSIVVNENGIYVGGFFSGTADFYTGASVGNLTSAGELDMFYGMYDFEGNAEWVNKHGSTENDAVYSIDVDPSGDLYVTGYFTGTIDIDASTNTVNRSSIGQEDIFLGRFSGLDGTMQWVHTMGSTDYDGSFVLDADDFGNLYIGGYFSGNIDLDPNTNDVADFSLVNPSRTGYDGYFAKYEAVTGNFLWAGILGSSAADSYVVTLAADNTGHVYVSGQSFDVVDFDLADGFSPYWSGLYSTTYLAKYNVSSGGPGSPDWVKLIGSEDEVGITAVDADERYVLVSGYFEFSSVDVDPEGSGQIMPNSGGEDAFLIRYYAESGAIDFSDKVGGEGNDAGIISKISPAGLSYFGGYFSNTVTFDDNADKVSAGYLDGFVAKYYDSREDPVQPVEFMASDVTSNSLTISFKSPEDPPNGFIAVRATGIPPGATPADGTEHELGSALGAGEVVYVGNETSFTESGLVPGTTYYYEIFSYRIFPGSYVEFANVSPLSGSVTTLEDGSPWTTKPNMNLERTYAMAGAVRGKLYVVGGQPLAGGSSVSVEEFDPTTNMWTSKASMPTSRSLAEAVVVDSRLYVIGGCINSDCGTGTTGVMEVYDPVSDQWTSSTSSNLMAMPTARSGVAVGVIGNKIYVAGGVQQCQPCNRSGKLEIYDVSTNTWSEGAQLPSNFHVGYAEGAVIDGKFYVVGGSTIVDEVDYMFVYDPASNLWESRTSALTARQGAGSGVLNDEFYVVSGVADGSAVSQLEVYNPSSNQWRTEASIPTARSIPASAVLRNELYIVGSGNIGQPITTVEAYSNGQPMAPVPTSRATSFSVLNLSNSSFTGNFIAGTDNPDGYLVIRLEQGSIFPVDGTYYESGTVITNVSSSGTVTGKGIVIYAGGATTFADEDLSPNTQYQYRIFSFNGAGSSTTYYIDEVLQGSVTTQSGSELAQQPNAQPGNPDFTNITSNSITYSFTPANGSPDGYIAIATIGLDPFPVPVDGRTYSVGQEIDAAVVFSVGSSFSGITKTDLTAATTYKLRIYSFNGSSETINYRIVEPAYGEVTTLATADVSAPTITHSAGGPLEPNSQLTINAQIVDDESGISRAEVYYTATENADEYSDFEYGTMTNTDATSFTFNIPASHVKGISVTYYIYAKNGAGLEQWTDDFVRVINIPSEGLQIPFNTFGDDQEDYRIVSFPLTPNNNSVANVIGDELGAKDDEKWRMFHYSNGNTQQLNTTSPLQLGNGYWLIVKDQPSASFMTGPGAYSNASIASPFKITLTNGWNQIGNPYNFDVSWEEILAYNENPGQIVPNLKVFKGSWSNGTELEKFSGGFVFANGSFTLEIPPYKDPSINGRKKSGKLKTPIDEPNWEVDLTVKAGALAFDLAGFGMNIDARADLDSYDDINLPPFLDYAQISHTKKINAFGYSRDIVPKSENHVWEFKVESNAAGDDAQLSWDNSYFGDNDRHLILWDVSRSFPVDMRAANNYRFNRSQSRLFQIFYGGRNFIREHIKSSSLSLYEAAPNPSKGAVVFSFSIPESTTKQAVALEIFDMLGKKVATVLNNELDPGFYAVEWNGLEDDLSRPAAGVYLTLLRSGNSTDLCRIILK